MHTCLVSAWVPVRTTVFDKEKQAEIVDQQISAFLSELPAVVQSFTPEIKKASLVVETPPTEVLSHLSRNSSLVSSKLFQPIRLIAEISFEHRASETPEDPAFLMSIAADYLTSSLEVALQLSELAYPGAVWTSEGVAIVDDKLVEAIDGKHCLSAVRPLDYPPDAWPPLRVMSLSQVAAWAISIGMLQSPLAATRVQRTLAAFTHVVGLGWQLEGEILFRAMQGLEAFYCDGVGDLRRQLAEKSRAWLGQTSEKQNIVAHLYDLRSQFIHGASKMRYWHDVCDPWGEDPNTMNRFSGGVDFAVRLLLATLQKCVHEVIADVTWSYSHTTETVRSSARSVS